MKAEEQYGQGGFRCALLWFYFVFWSADKGVLDVGNGTYEPLHGTPVAAPYPVNYGATN